MITALIVLTQLITESLPISSSTHVMVISTLLQRAGYVVPVLTEALDAILHIPSIGIVLGALWYWYGASVSRLIKNKQLFSWLYNHGIPLFIYAWLSTGVTLVVYFIRKTNSIGQWPHSYGLIISALLLLISACFREKTEKVVWWRALVVGAMQAIALFPGVSRFGATYAAGRMVGWYSPWALTYSFILQLILMSGALGRAVIQGTFFPTLTTLYSFWLPIVVVLGSFVSYGALRITMFLAQKRRMWVFAPYLILVAVFIFQLKIG